MKKVKITILAIFLLIILLITCACAYSRWEYVKEMEYCSFASDGDEEVVFYLEDGRTYKAIPFPEGLGHYDIVDVLSSVKRTKITEQTVWGKRILYFDPFGEGNEYVVIAPLPELPPLLPVSSIAIPFAYYAVEVETSENVD